MGLLRGGSRRVRLVVAAALTLLLGLTTAWAFGAFGGAGQPLPKPAGNTSPAAVDPGPDAVSPGAASSPGTAPKPGTGPASPQGARKGSSTAKAVTPTPEGSDGWKTRDSAVLGPSEALYFIAGTMYGDPPGNRFGTVSLSSTSQGHLRRGSRSGGSITQLVQAVKAVGGTVSVSTSKSGGGRVAFALPKAHTIELSTSGWVRIDGRDAFGLRSAGGGWTSTAVGKDLRAFLAGFIEGEGSMQGLIGDDPTAAHLAFIRALMATPQGYGVATVLEGKQFFHLYVASKADFPKVQAYPFLTYARVPGGKP